MRNLIQYPVTIPEIVDTLTRLAAEIVEKDEEDQACGNMDAYILNQAAKLIAGVPHDANDPVYKELVMARVKLLLEKPFFGNLATRLT